MDADASSKGASPSPPFPHGWYGWDLGDYRPCSGTYDLYAYDELPPLPAPDPTFAYLRTDSAPGDGGSGANAAYEAEIHRRLDTLASEAIALGMALPETFVRFMKTPILWRAILDSPTGCWVSLADHLVPCPGFPSGRLVGFVRDQQDCIIWCLCLLPGGAYRVLALGSDAADTLPSAQYDALLGQLDPEEDYDTWDRDQLEHPIARLRHTPEKVAEAIEGIVVCADTFEDFIYRFWLETELYLKLHAEEINRYSQPLLDRYLQPLTEQERAYLTYAYRAYYGDQGLPEPSFGSPPARSP